MTRRRITDITYENAKSRIHLDDGSVFDANDVTAATWLNRAYYIGKEFMLIDEGRYVICN